MFIDRLTTLGFKLEGTAYTAETLAQADYNTRIYNIKPSLEIEEAKRAYSIGDFAKFTSVMGKRKGGVSFSIDLAYSGTANVAPEWGKFLKACGYLETVGGASVTYSPNSTKNNIPATIEIPYRNEGALPVQVVVKLSGCMGNVKFDSQGVGKPVRADFEFHGVLVSVTDRAYANMIVPSAFNTTNPDGVLGSVLQCFGDNQTCDKVVIDTGNAVDVAVDPSNASGYYGAYIGDRNPTMVIDPYLDTIANRGYYAKWTAGTTGTFSMTIGSHLTLSAPAAQITKAYDMANRNGLVVNTLTCILTRTSGSNENDFTITQA